MGGELPIRRCPRNLAVCCQRALRRAGFDAKFAPPLQRSGKYANIPECEHCEYSLIGLPTCGKCPECGTEYSLDVPQLPSNGTIPPDWDDLAWELQKGGSRATLCFSELQLTTASLVILGDEAPFYDELDRILFASGARVSRRLWQRIRFGFSSLYVHTNAELENELRRVKVIGGLPMELYANGPFAGVNGKDGILGVLYSGPAIDSLRKGDLDYVALDLSSPVLKKPIGRFLLAEFDTLMRSSGAIAVDPVDNDLR